MYDMNVFQKFLDECGEKRRITEIAPAKLDSLLCNFYITAKKRTTQCTNLIQCHPSHEASSATWKTTKQLKVQYPQRRGIQGLKRSP